MQVDNSTFRNGKDFEVDCSISLAFHIVANFDSGNTSLTGLEMPGSNLDFFLSASSKCIQMSTANREKKARLLTL